jgi:triosephosphate isomerase
MATSSIFTNIKINDKKKASAFINAIDDSAAEPKRQPTAPLIPLVTDINAIRKLMTGSNRVK